MNRIHFLCVPFTGLGLFKGMRGKTWLKNRIEVFKKFVIPALMNQTKQEFIVWMCFRPEEKTDPIVQELQKSLESLRGMRFVFTWGGIPFYDDKYPDKIAKERLMESLELSLPSLKEYVSDNTDYVLMTIQPSDDCYLSHAIEEIQNVEYKEKQAVGYTQGYVCNYGTMAIAEWNPTTLPPFSTILFPPEVFLDPQKHFEHTGAYESHEYITKNLEFKPLQGRGFLVGTHGENISTGFTHAFRGSLLSEQEKEKVLIKTGLFLAKPIILKKDIKRKIMKRIINCLPSFMQRYIIRCLSPGVTSSIKSYKWFRV